MSKMIEFQDFSFTYDSQKSPTLKNINLTIEQGEKVLIVGPSGSGKSTLGQCLNGIIPNLFSGHHEGKLEISGLPFGRSIGDLSAQISTVLQDTDGQFIGLSVEEDIAFLLENDEIAQSEMKKSVKKWAETVDISQHLTKRPQDLSGGQKQRVSLAGVLVDEAPILLFDEPLANLDPQASRDTIELIGKIQAENQLTTIIIEHRIEEVLPMGIDRIILVNDGQILFNGSPTEILKMDILPQNGLREPLYIKVLKELKVDLTTFDKLDKLSDLDLPKLEFSSNLTEKSAEKSEKLLEIQNLKVGFDKKEILHGVNLTVSAGEKIAIVGKNGAGKSTFAKAICNFVKSDGTILFDGKNISDESISERAEKIGFVMQNPNDMISQHMIFDEVAFGLTLRGFSDEIIKEKVEAILKTCGLYQFRNWPISALSYGQKKRVTIASILVLEPKVLILDEPTAAQDLRNYQEIMNFLDEINQKLNVTLIMISHDMHLISEYSVRAVVFLDGQIIADDEPLKILANPELVKSANLRQTSLYELADKLSVKSDEFVHHFSGGLSNE